MATDEYGSLTYDQVTIKQKGVQTLTVGRPTQQSKLVVNHDKATQHLCVVSKKSEGKWIDLGNEVIGLVPLTSPYASHFVVKKDNQELALELYHKQLVCSDTGTFTCAQTDDGCSSGDDYVGPTQCDNSIGDGTDRGTDPYFGDHDSISAIEQYELALCSQPSGTGSYTTRSGETMTYQNGTWVNSSGTPYSASGILADIVSSAQAAGYSASYIDAIKDSLGTVKSATDIAVTTWSFSYALAQAGYTDYALATASCYNTTDGLKEDGNHSRTEAIASLYESIGSFSDLHTMCDALGLNDQFYSESRAAHNSGPVYNENMEQIGYITVSPDGSARSVDFGYFDESGRYVNGTVSSTRDGRTQLESSVSINGATVTTRSESSKDGVTATVVTWSKGGEEVEVKNTVTVENSDGTSSEETTWTDPYSGNSISESITYDENGHVTDQTYYDSEGNEITCDYNSDNGDYDHDGYVDTEDGTGSYVGGDMGNFGTDMDGDGYDDDTGTDLCGESCGESCGMFS